MAQASSELLIHSPRPMDAAQDARAVISRWRRPTWAAIREQFLLTRPRSTITRLWMSEYRQVVAALTAEGATVNSVLEQLQEVADVTEDPDLRIYVRGLAKLLGSRMVERHTPIAPLAQNRLYKALLAYCEKRLRRDH